MGNSLLTIGNCCLSAPGDVVLDLLDFHIVLEFDDFLRSVLRDVLAFLFVLWWHIFSLVTQVGRQLEDTDDTSRIANSQDWIKLVKRQSA